ELQRHGVDQLLTGGQIDRGMYVLRSVLDATGMHLARGPRTALASLMWRRAQLRWRGLAFTEHSTEEIPPEDLRRIDTCWSVVTGLALVDNLHALDYNTRHLLLALDAGEPYRIARALAVEAAFLATGGERSR